MSYCSRSLLLILTTSYCPQPPGKHDAPSGGGSSRPWLCSCCCWGWVWWHNHSQSKHCRHPWPHSSHPTQDSRLANLNCGSCWENSSSEDIQKYFFQHSEARYSRALLSCYQRPSSWSLFWLVYTYLQLDQQKLNPYSGITLLLLYVESACLLTLVLHLWPPESSECWMQLILEVQGLWFNLATWLVLRPK